MSAVPGTVDREEPAVDVGIAAWGASPFLEQAIRSVEGQTLQAWRLHLLQDGQALPVVERLVASRADARMTYAAARSGGAARTKTRLIRQGRARYVALLDHDDLWDPEFLERRVAFLDAERACALVFSPTSRVDRDGALLERHPRLLEDGVYTPDEIVPRLLRWSGIAGGTVVVRRSAYEQVGAGFSPQLPRTYDYEMWLRLGLRFPAGYLGIWDTYWRRHGENASLAQLERYEDEYELLVAEIAERIRHERPDLLPAARTWPSKVATLLLTTALDALEGGHRRAAWRFLTCALRRHPAAGLDARTWAVALGVAGGGPGAAVVTAARARRRLTREPMPS